MQNILSVIYKPMKAEGITIDAITPQNEPLHGGNNPSMVMQAAEQSTFIKNHLGPAFQAASINTKIHCLTITMQTVRIILYLC
jgi:O-glycosyl hydrolase